MLRQLRTRLASEAKLPPYLVLHDKTLVELAERRPQNLAALSGITGLGTSKIARYGASLIEVITAAGDRSSARDDALLAPSTTAQPKLRAASEALDPRLPAPAARSLAMSKQGMDAEAIAAERGISVATVYSHFAAAIEAGIADARSVLTVDDSEIDEILAVFERLDTVETGKLGPAHAALAGRYDYGVLECLLAELA
jgi:ATP-dependent DNA helicase RecQ